MPPQHPPLDPDAANAQARYRRPARGPRSLALATGAAGDGLDRRPPDRRPAGGEIPLRVHRPGLSARAPVLVYFHGGGMCMGSNHSFEPLARHLAHSSGATVVSVGYHLAPESPPPAQFDDAYAATLWTAEHADDIAIDPDRLVVIGDSAGGTLAAAVALAARDRNGPAISCQVLICPGLDRDMGARSISECADAPILSRDDVLFLNETADGGQGYPDDPHRIPAYADDLAGLPPAIVVTAECDPLRDWGERYAHRLREARVQTTLTRYIGGLLRAKFAHPLPF